MLFILFVIFLIGFLIGLKILSLRGDFVIARWTFSLCSLLDTAFLFLLLVNSFFAVFEHKIFRTPPSFIPRYVAVLLVIALQIPIFASSNFIQFFVCLQAVNFVYYFSNFFAFQKERPCDVATDVVHLLSDIVFLTCVFVLYHEFHSFSFNGISNLITIKKIDRSREYDYLLGWIGLVSVACLITKTFASLFQASKLLTKRCFDHLAILHALVIQVATIFLVEKVAFLFADRHIVYYLECLLAVIAALCLILGSTTRDMKRFLLFCTLGASSLFFYATFIKLYSVTSLVGPYVFMTSFLYIAVGTIIYVLSCQDSGVAKPEAMHVFESKNVMARTILAALLINCLFFFVTRNNAFFIPNSLYNVKREFVMLFLLMLWVLCWVVFIFRLNSNNPNTCVMFDDIKVLHHSSRIARVSGIDRLTKSKLVWQKFLQLQTKNVSSFMTLFLMFVNLCVFVLYVWLCIKFYTANKLSDFLKSHNSSNERVSHASKK